MPSWLQVFALSLLVLVVVRGLGMVVLAVRFHRSRAWEATGVLAQLPNELPSVTVLVPAFNEELTIGNCLQGLSAQTYERLEIVVVDDGSTDGTTSEVLLEAAAADRPIRLLSQPNGGKAAALNSGILQTSSDIVVCVDADSILAPDAIAEIVRPFADPSVGAVAGVVRIANPRTLLSRQQAMEYISGLMLQRAAFAQIDAIPVMSGAISAFRRVTLQEIGGYSEDTLVEDFDVTVAIHRTGQRVIMNPNAVAYTEGPQSLGDLRKQRHRWVFGGFQVLGKYRRTLFTGEFGNLSRYGLPYALLMPWIDVAVSVLFILTLVLALAGGGFAGFVWAFVAFSVVLAAANLFALRLSGESWKLAIDGFFAPLFYAHLLTLTTAMAGWSYLRKSDVKWDPLVRFGDNTLSDTSATNTANRERVSELTTSK